MGDAKGPAAMSARAKACCRVGGFEVSAPPVGTGSLTRVLAGCAQARMYERLTCTEAFVGAVFGKPLCGCIGSNSIRCMTVPQEAT